MAHFEPIDDLAGRLAQLNKDFSDPEEELQENSQNYFLHPSTAAPKTLKDQDTASSYLTNVETNVKAEFWAFLLKQSKNFPGWRKKHLKTLKMDQQSFTGDDSTVFEVFEWDPVRERKTGEEGGEFGLNLVIYKGYLYLLKSLHGGSAAGLPEEKKFYSLSNCGMGLDLEWPDRSDYKEDDMCFSYGYIGDRINDLFCVQSLAAARLTPTLVTSVASPKKRVLVPYVMHGGGLPEPSRSSSSSGAVIPINQGQKDALEGFQHDIEFIQGPPGTGKSTTIYHVVKTFAGIEGCALVACVSNKAIDAIADKFEERLNFIVVGNENRLGTTAKKWTLSAQISRNPEVVFWSTIYDKLLESAKTISDAKDSGAGSQSTIANKIILEFETLPIDFLKTCASKVLLRKEIKPMNLFEILADEISIARAETAHRLSKHRLAASLEIKNTCNALLSTIDSFGSALAHLDRESQTIGPRISLAVLDEAGTIPEAKVCVVIATLPQATRIVSIGDQEQLEPFTDLDRRGQKFTDGFFHRAARVLPGAPMLFVQFRMHPHICRLASAIAYGGGLQTDPDVAQLRLKTCGDSAISWISYDREGVGESRPKKSFMNEQELLLVCDVVVRKVDELRRMGKTLLVITFYKEQLVALRNELADQGILDRDKKTRQPVDSDLIRVTTVDSAQGSEADEVILSTVRCNNRADIGFLVNKNRLVVSISRAKEHLTIIGHKETVAAKGIWRRVLNESTKDQKRYESRGVAGGKSKVLVRGDDSGLAGGGGGGINKVLTRVGNSGLAGGGGGGGISKTWWAEDTETDEESDVLTRLRLILNKLTVENFDRLSNEFLAGGINGGSTFISVPLLEGAIDIIVDKTQVEQHFGAMYADLCLKMARMPITELGEEGKGKQFKKSLLQRCQIDFERDQSTLHEQILSLPEEERNEQSMLIRKRYLGHIKFMGHLFRADLLSDKIMHCCLAELLGKPKEAGSKGSEGGSASLSAWKPEEDKLQCFCTLMAAIGHQLEENATKKAEYAKMMKSHFKSIEELSDSKVFSSRIRSIGNDLLEMRKNGWYARTQTAVLPSSLTVDSGGNGCGVPNRSNVFTGITVGPRLVGRHYRPGGRGVPRLLSTKGLSWGFDKERN